MVGMGKRAALLLGILLSWGLPGCGLLFSGSQSSIPVESNPSSAEVWLDGVLVGRTPTEVQVDSGEHHVLTFRRDGYPDQTVRLESKLNGGYVLLDILFTGLVGVVVDAATGGWYVNGPDSVHVDLQAAQRSAERSQ